MNEMREFKGYFIDNFSAVEKVREAPNRVSCVRCGEPPTIEGHDPCIANLPGVIAACCGHGRTQPYALFSDGRVLRGRFDHHE